MGAEFDLMQKAKELFDSGRTHTEIVLEVRHDELWVAKSIEIMNLSKDILKAYEEGKISRAAAEALCSIPANKRKQVFEKAVELSKKG